MTQLPLWDETIHEAVSWLGTRASALDRLNDFLPRAGRAYAAGRNHDFGPPNRSNISCLSPWIRHRAILESEVVQRTLELHSPTSAEKFIQEVFWRGYFKGWLEQRPSVWTHYRKDLTNLVNDLDRNINLRDRYENAICGQTGIDCFDAWSKELLETGYLHNHARMWFASIWIFTLKLPWQLGADFFLRSLLDGDPASNTLSWRWVAGLHTKGKTYLARKSNIERFTNGRFSPSGLADHAEPLTESYEYPLQPLNKFSPLEAEEAFGLIITEEDCSPETLCLPARPRAVCGLTATAARSPSPVAKPAVTFAAEAIGDALERAKTGFDCPVSFIETHTWSSTIITWAKTHDIKTVVTAYAPVGPVQEAFDRAKPELETAGIRLVFIRRAYDDICWRHATKGFFKLKAEIPSIIKQLNLI